MNTTTLVSRLTISELCAARDASVDTFRRGISTVREAFALAATAAPGANFALPHRHMADGMKYGDDARQVEQWQQSIDRACWNSIISSTGMRGMLNRAALREFNETIDKSPPAFTVETVIATMADLAARAPDMMNKTVVDAFRALSRRYKSNDPTKFDRRVVLRAVFHPYGFTNTYAEADVRDIERTFYLLDGKQPPDYGDLTDWLRSTRRDDNRAVHDTEYFRARGFKNGNLHLEFKRADLVDRANDILAQVGGAVLTDQT